MKFMVVRTWEPHEISEIIKRRTEKGMMLPEGVKVIGEWLATDGSTQFVLIDAASDLACWQWYVGWADLGKNRSFNVVEVKDEKATQVS